MPNTYMMQELVRTFVDQYTEELENGGSLETPTIYRIPKGTPIPRTLILLQEHTAQFSLQPSRPTSLKGEHIKRGSREDELTMSFADLNTMLDDFYATHGEAQTAEHWLDEHDFQSAVADDAVSEWTAI
ncbi:MAG: hypothetical protein M1817_004910 [Caeruleum heppii]|nr:MAG: hypothetical protein M1817_004910 [Caeruleum heppii]